ncbi:unnamed protein product [Allacma fusca]|uniref:Protein SYS1 homolog n=1 Tax=Allacma fusca TaxID=39272 RepID=A0A8J2LSQ9_9HEXA|nr:unnamed protein product [Allacma fusca]
MLGLRLISAEFETIWRLTLYQFVKRRKIRLYGMGGQFRLNVWDPKLITSQIVAVLSFFYFSFGILLVVGSIVTGSDLALGNVFGYKSVNFGDKHGVMVVICYVVNALMGSLALCVIVKRTKQCLDFTTTTYIFHLIICWMYNGVLPTSPSWWLMTVAGIAVMCVCGEFLCLKQEMQDIPLLGGRVDL